MWMLFGIVTYQEMIESLMILSAHSVLRGFRGIRGQQILNTAASLTMRHKFEV